MEYVSERDRLAADFKARDHSVDISMPWYEAGNRQCSVSKVPDAKTVIMSQDDASILAAKAVEVGFHACIDKSHLGFPIAALNCRTFGDFRSLRRTLYQDRFGNLSAFRLIQGSLHCPEGFKRPCGELLQSAARSRVDQSCPSVPPICRF